MAHMVGGRKTESKTSGKQAFFLIIAAVLAASMLFSLEDVQKHTLSVLGTLLILAALFGSALNKSNPMLWKKVFRRKEYELLSRIDMQIYEALQTLDDRHYVLCKFNFELLYVDFLVLGPQGITVIAPAAVSQPLHINQGILMAGAESLEKITGNLWRKCHLINLLLKKGYSLDLLPNPVLVLASRNDQTMKEFDGISIVSPKELAETIESIDGADVPYEKIQGFAAYLKQRYFRS